MEHSKIRLKNLEKALSRLEDALKILAENKSNKFYETSRDSVIKRFEFCFDLFWKCLKDYLEIKHGIQIASPRSSFRECLTQKFIDQKEFQVLDDMIGDRNNTSHRYDEGMAEEIAERTTEYLPIMENIGKRLKNS